MMIAALGALLAGALAGVFLASRHFLRKRMPAWGAVLHGVGGATGFTLVLLTVVAEPDFRLIRAVMYVLIATIALGSVNLLFHVRRVRHRTSLILMHGLCAVSGASWLVYAIWAHRSVETANAAQAPIPAETAASGAGPAPAPAPAPARAPAPEKRVAAAFSIDAAVQGALARPIYFDRDRAELSLQSRDAVAAVADVLKAHPEVTLVEVQGHADERGDDAYNVALTRQRAALVVSALVSSGVAPDRLRGAGYGARCPAEPACRQNSASPACHGASRWDKDRRVVFQVLKIGSTPFPGEVVCARASDLISEEDRTLQR